MGWYHKITVVAALVALAGCQKAAPELAASDVAAVKANYTDWAAAVANRDFSAVAKLVTADIWAFQPDQPAIVGREAIVAWTKTWPPDFRQTWVVDEVGGYLDLAFSRATVTESWALPDGKRETEQAVCVSIHRRQPDGTWQFSRSISHALKPPPAPPTDKR